MEPLVIAALVVACLIVGVLLFKRKDHDDGNPPAQGGGRGESQGPRGETHHQ